MTQDEIICMAREAGLPIFNMFGKTPDKEALERFAALVAEATKAQPQGEPVAWMDAEGDVYKLPVVDKWLPPHKMLYTTPPSVEAAIEATKEKAAKVCDDYKCVAAAEYEAVVNIALDDCAAAIRSMK